MPNRALVTAAPGAAQAPPEDLLALTFRCARPRCRDEFTRTVGVGRRKQYCSDICRGLAEKEYKQAKAAVAHYERLLQQAQADLTGFGRDPDTTTGHALPVNEEEGRRRARASLDHARGVAAFASPSDERVLEVLKDVVASVGPLLD